MANPSLSFIPMRGYTRRVSTKPLAFFAIVLPLAYLASFAVVPPRGPAHASEVIAALVVLVTQSAATLALRRVA